MNPPTDPQHCTSFAAGHHVHWVQGMRSGRTEERIHEESCTVTETSGDGWCTVVTDDGERYRYWHHDPAAIERLVGFRSLRINRKWSIIRTGGGRGFFSVSTTPRPCRTDEAIGTPAERLASHGGFTLTDDETRQLLEKPEPS